MNFDLDEQQQAFQQTVARFLAEHCPLSRALAPHARPQLDLPLWRGMMDLGLGRILVPEEYAGLGLGLLELGLVTEIVGRYCAPGPFLEHQLAILAVALAGTDEQKRRWLPRLASGQLRGTVALSEGQGRWLAEDWALPDEEAISGTKHFVLNAADADLTVVGLRGGVLAVLEAGALGMRVISVPCIDAGKMMARLELSNTRAERLPGAAGSRLCDAGIVLVAADAFGGASQCLAASVAYAKERRQFGRAVGSFQAVKHQLADLAAAVEPAQGLYWYAALAFDQEPGAAAEAAALAKAHITEVYVMAARRAIEVHGGLGYTWEAGIHVWLKRALFDQSYLGSPRRHRERAAGFANW